jgi:hypothetical protein
MNYFPFDPDPRASAIALDDKRLPRVFHEAVMTLSKAQYVLTGVNGPYSPLVPIPKRLLDWVCADGESWFVAWVREMLFALRARNGDERVGAYACYLAYCNLAPRFNVPRAASPPLSFPNLAKASIKGLDYTHEPDTHLAYRNYMSAQWQGIDKRPCVWTTHGRPLWAVDILPQDILEFLGA